MTVTHFSEKTKIADFIYEHSEILSILPRFGISLGFGDKSIADICKEKNIPYLIFKSICEIYISPQNDFQFDSTNTSDLQELIKYLKLSHIDYLENQIPHVEKHLTELLNLIPERPDYVKLMNDFFQHYKQDLKIHFDDEDKVVFPYIENLIRKEKTDYTILTFEENHSNIEEKLNDLILIILKYLPEQLGGQLRNHVLFLLFLLEKDIQKHMILENQILIPLVKDLEKNVQKK